MGDRKEEKRRKSSGSDPAAISYADLFLSILKINAFTFGGGYVIVAVISDEFVQKRKLIGEEEMLDLVTLAKSGPGPMAVNSSVLVGYRMRGLLGAVISLLASILPSLLIISLLYPIYRSFQSSPWVQSAFRVMSGSLAAILLLTTLKMARPLLKESPLFSLLLLGGCLLARLVFKVNSAWLILFCGFLGWLTFGMLKKGKKGGGK